jgi:TRAP-type mannitol/chloroaromatic compound transport system permease small subunit
MDALLVASNAIDRAVGKIGEWAGWLFVACVVVIVFDVVSRKFGFQLPGLGSTRLQELEWHLHTAIFSFWLGLAYIKNAHVRIDIAVTKTSPRVHAWLEFAGCLIFALPYTLLALYFSVDFAWTAYAHKEVSDSATGLPYRFVPKSFLAIGLALLLIAVFSVILRVVVYLWGPERLRKAATFAGAKQEQAP